jgi:hypothetical protein
MSKIISTKPAVPEERYTTWSESVEAAIIAARPARVGFDEGDAV